MIVALPVAGIIINSGIQHRKDAIAAAEVNTQVLAERIVHEQEDIIVTAREMLISLSQLSVIKQENGTKVTPLLKEMHKLHSDLVNIFVADRSGLVWATAVPLKPPFSISDRRYFKNALATGQLSSGEYVISRSANKPTFNLGYPIKDEQGDIKGVIGVGFSLEKYKQILERSKLPKNSSFAILDHKGIILFRGLEPEKFIGKPVDPLLFKQFQEAPDEITFIGKSLALGDERIISTRKLRLPGESSPYMYLRVGIPVESALSKANTSFINDLMFFCGILILALISSSLIVQRFIVSRISLLGKASHALASGDYQIKIADLVKGGELGSLAESFDIMANKLIQREEALSSNERFLKAIIDTEPECIKMLDIDCNLLMMNRAGLEMIDADSFEQVKGQCVCPLITDRYKDDFFALTKQVFQGVPGILEFETIGLKGRHVWLETHAVPFCNDRGEIIALLGITRDITNRKVAEEERTRLEQKIQHTQKLESLGVLAGGIAHDFNNILMAIIGNADLALMRINPASPAVENLQRIEQAAARAADLAKQMLAYSGKGKFVVENINLNHLLEEMLHMLEVSISKKAILRLNLATVLPSVEADATQMRQIVMNLVINASEAIGEKSGVIAITTGCMDCDKSYLKDVWLSENISEGLYVYLEIADTGCGMDKETLTRVFDPFFTTKFTGRGLGMAAVHGIIRGHNGAIKVYSEVGKGTTFKILLPASDRPVEIFNGESHKDNWKGSGTVLLVDDEETVRGIGKEMLLELGFTAITANDGKEAVEIFKTTPNIALVILDLTMPRMDGEQCFRELRQLKPDVKVILSSGYNQQEVTQKFIGKGLAGFIQKPYKLSTLKDAIRGIA
jgi:PAS domain S-box-containing protein